MTNLYLIRHGEAVSNVRPILAGMNGDAGLTERGVEQAERLRDRLAASGEIAADILIASTLPRARQTAEIIAPALDLPLTFDDEVQELRVGQADGLTVDEAHERFGMPNFRKEPLAPIAPDGESWGSFLLRVGSALSRIAREQAGKTVVIVCHGGVIDGSLIYFMNLPTLQLPPVDFYTHNTSLTHWGQRMRDGQQRWRLEKYNDVAHLGGIDVQEALLWEPTARSDGEAPSVPIPTEE